MSSGPQPGGEANGASYTGTLEYKPGDQHGII